MTQARVTSIPTLEAFRATLAEFAADAQDALSGVEAEIRRTETWLSEQQKFWQRELRKRQDAVQQAKNELSARKYQNRDGRGLGSTEQEKALKKAQARLDEAETKLANCRRWAPLLHHAVHEYHGPARQLAGVLETDVLQALALLANKLVALEAYLNIAPPPAPGPSATESVAGPPEMVSAAVPVPEPVALAPPDPAEPEEKP